MTSPDGAEACRVSPDRLRDFASAVYRTLGLAEDDAHLCADTLVQADLWGHQSHGVLRLPWYAARLKAGVCDPRARPEIVTDAGGLAVIDGHDAMGQVVAAFGAREAIARAKRHGIAAVAMRNSNHFGTAMYFTLMAPPQGCVAFLATNASPAMAPWGGREKTVGTNPWSWAAPAGDRAPLVLDIANTGVARGKIYLARQEGRPIPEGWAITADGAPTTDPTEAIAGVILPMAQHKGYGIALVMDMLAGVLTGSAFGADVHGPYQSERKSGAGHLMIAIDIDTIQPRDQFAARMGELITSLKRVPTAQGFDEILYPGEREARDDAENRRLGLALPDDTRTDLTRLAAELGLADTLPF
ncbi:Ldh family oxidoreductase [Rhodoplanes sp. SY1]|uniref:Ldh family oxidoreductase n=1 Tax=Rhodoplanes sp. SY1 TaxID=3166646 RepID=UPI0038B5DB12